MFAHIGVNVRDLRGAKAYYDVLMPLVDFEPYMSTTEQFSYRPAQGQPGTTIFFYPALEAGTYSRHCPGLQHLAFRVESRQAVRTVHAKAQELGSPIIHPPQVFPQYRPYYYAVFWSTPDGFMLEAVCLREEEE